MGTAAERWLREGRCRHGLLKGQCWTCREIPEPRSYTPVQVVGTRHASPLQDPIAHALETGTTVEVTIDTSALFCCRLKGKRLDLGWTQARVAEKFGVSSSTVRGWERGTSQPWPWVAEKIEKWIAR